MEEVELEAAQIGDGTVDSFPLGLQKIKENSVYCFRKRKEKVEWFPVSTVLAGERLGAVRVGCCPCGKRNATCPHPLDASSSSHVGDAQRPGRT